MDPSAFSSSVAIRRVVEVDIDPVVALALRAWAPVFGLFVPAVGVMATRRGWVVR